ncbi:peptidyl-prolyl cis-trans isomerase FKBP11 [Rhinatrema bivittatum]|uniref:peptidyl-prolyl cis-trans isomerase FKBP11 n=1 Tax=Rhinatrema bivittatum TaxID=194408 RepID=UPI00112EC2CB|nr:peptidyl-prolyl cis-trans isomerase FKBP11 [Rhinatrema bivittatum]
MQLGYILPWVLPLLFLLCCPLTKAQSDTETTGELLIETLLKPDSCSVTAAMGDTLHLHYTGKLQDGRVIDSSLSRDPLVVEIGKKQVIPGLEQSLLDMCVGEKRRVTIPPHLAYGKRGYPPSIPENAVLQFETTVIALFKATYWQKIVSDVLPMICIGLVPALLALIGFHLCSKAKTPHVSKKKLKEEKRNKKK